MSSAVFIQNPHYPGSPARMSDGRLFTNYHGHGCAVPSGTPNYDQRQQMIQNGVQLMQTDRVMTAMAASRTGSVCVDTMVPELTKRVYRWDGPVGTRLAHPAGIGSGRLYLPGRVDLVTADPDVLAEATCSFMSGTFDPSKLYTQVPSAKIASASLPARHNRYSAPYGN